jgi:hypothetical protein
MKVLIGLRDLEENVNKDEILEKVRQLINSSENCSEEGNFYYEAGEDDLIEMRF